jgi:hypothetical protein
MRLPPMSRRPRIEWVAAAAIGLLSLAAARGQQTATPHIGYVYPAGGRQGTAFQVKLGGRFLDGATNAWISGEGVRATVLQHTKPLTQQQFNALREKAKELQEKRQAIQRERRRGEATGTTNLVWTAADEKALAEIRAKLGNFQRRPPNPAIAETVTLQVQVSADADPGERELRLGVGQGLSNPLMFCVGQLPEVRKPEATAQNQAPTPQARRNNAQQQAVAPFQMHITLPAVVNGQILPGGVDRYKFFAREGQKLVLAVKARGLIPYIPDAVPGWFQATLTLSDAKGKELAYNDDFHLRPDPVMYFEVPKDGEYVAEIKDSVFRGREDFVYRVSISESPFVTGIFPLGGPAGSETSVALRGWNLPVATVMSPGSNSPGLYPIGVCKEKAVSNHVPFAVDTLPECLEQEPNDSAETAQKVTLPVIVNGRIGRPGDADVFSFQGRAGEEIVLEVYARRLDSPLDSLLMLSDASGKQVAVNDDHEDKGSGLNTHHADSYIRARLPESGPYFVRLSDAQHQGGADFAYRLRLSEPRPDFELRVTPSSINAHPVLSVPLTVYALRKDGFTNEIALALDGAPAGFNLGGARIPAGEDQVRVTLAAGGGSQKDPVNISLEGRAMIQGRFISRRAVPAEDMMQAFAYRHLVPAQDLKVAVTGRSFGRAGVSLASSTPLKIPAVGTARIQLRTPAPAFLERFELELSDPPEGLSIKEVAATNTGAEILLQANSGKLKPGLKGNLIVNLVPGKNGPQQKANKQPNARRGAVGTLPAIPFEVVAGD